MRRVVAEDELPAALLAGSREAASAFGDGAVYLEREIIPARHIEVQLLGDAAGDVVAIGERDCSIQRRHQKLIEEAPAPGLTEIERRRLHAMAVRMGSAAGLRNAATCEFLYDRDGDFWFLEVNTRLQVEHPVTELVAGLDIVHEQFRLAAGEPLSTRVRAAAERAARPSSHAIEVRVSAEDPARVFAPTPGRITRWRMPSGPGIRVDTAVEEGDRVPAEYDPLIAKLIVHAADRPAALARLRRAVGRGRGRRDPDDAPVPPGDAGRARLRRCHRSSRRRGSTRTGTARAPAPRRSGRAARGRARGPGRRPGPRHRDARRARRVPGRRRPGRTARPSPGGPAGGHSRSDRWPA